MPPLWIYPVLLGVLFCVALVGGLLVLLSGPKQKDLPTTKEVDEKIRAGLRRANLDPKTVWK